MAVTFYQAMERSVVWYISVPSEVTAGTPFNFKRVKIWTLYSCFSLLFKEDP